jgi:hypothetical protein
MRGMISACMRFPKYPTADPCISATQLPSTRDAFRGLLDWEDQVPKRQHGVPVYTRVPVRSDQGSEMRHSNWCVDLRKQECTP